MFFDARYNIFLKLSSLVNDGLFLVIFRNCLLSPSIIFVVYIIFRTSAGYAKNVDKMSQFSYQLLTHLEYRGWSCEKGLAHEYIYPGAVEFSDGTLLCTNVTMYPSAAGIFFSASANTVPETDCAYRSQVQRQLDRKLELDRRNGNTAYGKNGIDVFQNLNNGGSDVRKKATVVTAFRSEVQ